MQTKENCASAPITSAIRLVLLDDHPLMRAGVAATLARNPRMRLVAQIGRASEARGALQNTSADVLLLDLLLGGERGLEDALALIVDCRCEQPGVRVLVLSTIEEPAYARRALAAGAAGYVGKGEPEESLLAAIEMVYAGGTYLSPRIFVDAARRFAPMAGTLLGEAAARLTNRELHVLHAAGLGLPNRRIAEDLGLSVKTIETYKESLKQKLGVADSAQLTAIARDYMAALRA